jgi:hypothetical protein
VSELSIRKVYIYENKRGDKMMNRVLNALGLVGFSVGITIVVILLGHCSPFLAIGVVLLGLFTIAYIYD